MMIHFVIFFSFQVLTCAYGPVSSGNLPRNTDETGITCSSPPCITGDEFLNSNTKKRASGSNYWWAGENNPFKKCPSGTAGCPIFSDSASFGDSEKTIVFEKEPNILSQSSFQNNQNPNVQYTQPSISSGHTPPDKYDQENTGITNTDFSLPQNPSNCSPDSIGCQPNDTLDKATDIIIDIVEDNNSNYYGNEPDSNILPFDSQNINSASSREITPVQGSYNSDSSNHRSPELRENRNPGPLSHDIISTGDQDTPGYSTSNNPNNRRPGHRRNNNPILQNFDPLPFQKNQDATGLNNQDFSSNREHGNQRNSNRESQVINYPSSIRNHNRKPESSRSGVRSSQNIGFQPSTKSQNLPVSYNPDSAINNTPEQRKNVGFSSINRGFSSGGNQNIPERQNLNFPSNTHFGQGSNTENASGYYNPDSPNNQGSDHREIVDQGVPIPGLPSFTHNQNKPGSNNQGLPINRRPGRRENSRISPSTHDTPSNKNSNAPGDYDVESPRNRRPEHGRRDHQGSQNHGFHSSNRNQNAAYDPNPSPGNSGLRSNEGALNYENNPVPGLPFKQNQIDPHELRPLSTGVSFGGMPMMMMPAGMNPIGGSCSAGSFCVPSNTCNPYTGFIIRDINAIAAVRRDQPQVPLVECFVPAQSIEDGVCCQEAHPIAGTGLD